MENLEIKVNLSQVDVSVKNLIKSIIDESDIDITVEKQLDLWKICEKLNPESFTSLKGNVYFSDFLRSICISILSSKDSFTYTTEQNVDSNDPEAHLVEKSEKNSKVTKIGKLFTSNVDKTHLPELSTSLDDLQLPDRYLKLVKRLRNASLSNATFRLGETLGDLVNLSIYEVASLQGVGASYVETLRELKLLAQAAPAVELVETLASDSKFKFPSVDVGDMRLILAGVDSKFFKALEKYERHIGVNDLSENLDEILKLDRNVLIAIPGFGAGFVNKLIDLKLLIKKEIELIVSGQVSITELDSTLIGPKVFKQLPLSKIEKVLLEDIDAYFDKISEDDVDVAQRRWGFVETKQTLEEIAADLNVTRERVRQKEVKINYSFLRHMRISQRALWQLLEPELSSEISIIFKNLFSCFTCEKDFYDFLGLMCGQEGLFEYVYPELDRSIMNSCFAEKGAPIHIDDVREYLLGLSLSEVRSVDNAIRYLAQLGVLFIEGEHVWPKQLSKAEASACVLVNHEKGLPWLDVAKLVNGNGYSKTDIYEDRLDTEAFKLPEYIFLAGKGIYKHTSFIDIDPASLDEIFIKIMEYAELNARSVFHLNESYHASSYLQGYDYFVIRHFVKNFGEDYGFYFDGRSQADSVGLEKGFKNITQKDVIIEAMNRSDKPLTKPEVANLIKSKSSAHAAFYLDDLIDKGKVVQVDRMLYTTPDMAYKNINIDEYIFALGEVLRKYEKPVESSVFKEELNLIFSKSFSKYFYSSIARLYAKKQGWFRKHSLYSVSEIPFKSLKAVLDSVCRLDVSTNENIVLLQAHVAISHGTAAIALANWRNAPVN